MGIQGVIKLLRDVLTSMDDVQVALDGLKNILEVSDQNRSYDLEDMNKNVLYIEERGNMELIHYLQAHCNNKVYCIMDRNFGNDDVEEMMDQGQSLSSLFTPRTPTHSWIYGCQMSINYGLYRKVLSISSCFLMITPSYKFLKSLLQSHLLLTSLQT